MALERGQDSTKEDKLETWSHRLEDVYKVERGTATVCGYHVYNKQSSDRRRVKIVQLQNLSTKQAVDLQEEIQVLKEIKGCAGVQGVLEVFHEVDRRCLVYEDIMGSTLRQSIESSGPVSEDEAKAIFSSILSAVDYCHSRGIAIRGLATKTVVLMVSRWPRHDC